MHLETVGGSALETGAAVSVTVESKFMQNYRIGAAANAGSEVAAIANGAGAVELFTLGTDQKVWNFYPDAASATGYSMADTGLRGTAIAAGLNAAGRLVVFAAYGAQLGQVTEINQPGQRWSAPAYCAIPLPSGSTGVARIFAERIAGKLYVAALTGASGPMPGIQYHLSCAIWPASGAPAALNRTTVTISTLNCVWTGVSAATASFTVVDTVILDYAIASGQLTRRNIAATFTTIDVDTATDSAGNDQLLAILKDGNVYRLVGGGTVPLNWEQLSVSSAFKQVRMIKDQVGALHAFVLGTNNRLYHLAPSASALSGFLAPAPIMAGVSQIGLALNDVGDIDLYAVGAAQNTISHLYLEEDSSNWAVERLDVATAGTVEDFASFSSDLTLTDAAGAPLGDEPVLIWAAAEAHLVINGSNYVVDARRPARVSANSAGMLAVAQQASMLAAPELLVSVPRLMTAGDGIAVAQNANTNARLAALDGTALMAAQDQAGNDILAGSYRNQGTADSVAKAVSQCVSMGSSASMLAAASPLYLNQRRANVGARHYNGDPGLLRHMAAAHGAEPHWLIGFAGPVAAYRALDAHEAAGLLAEKRAGVASANGLFDWIEDIGDLIMGVAADIVSIVDTIITTVGNAVNAAITFVVDGVTYLFETVVSAIEQALDLAQLVFSQVKIFFEQLYEWLALLFNWDDMLRTHEALAYVLNQGLSFLSLAAGGMQRAVDSGIVAFQAQLHTLFQNAIAQIAGQHSIGGYEQANAASSAPFASSVSNNMLFNQLVDNAGSAMGQDLLARLRTEDNDPVSDIIAQLTQFADLGLATDAFVQARTYFTNLGGSPDQIFTQLLSGLLSVAEGILQAMMSGVKAVLDALFALVQSLLAAFQALLNEEWDIPFVSQFYSFITHGAKLTTIDLMALVLAVPTTILYKVVYNHAPFPDAASVDAFKAAFSATSMFAATGLGGSTTRDKTALVAATGEAWTGLVPTTMATLLNIAGTVGTFVYACLTGLLDAFPPAPNTTPPSIVTRGAYLAEIIGQFCSFPWFYSSAKPDCSTSDGRGCWVWLYQCTGILMDTVFIYKEGSMPENWEDRGVYLGTIYGVGHLALAIAASAGQSGTPIAAAILPTIPELAKPLRLTKIAAATEDISLIVLGAADGIFGLSSAITAFIATQQNIPNGSGPDVLLQLDLAIPADTILAA